MEQWLTKLDPSTATLNFLVYLIILGIGLFVWRKLWPWFTTEYWPARVRQVESRLASERKQDEQQTVALQAIRDVLEGLKTLTNQQWLILRQHDDDTRRASNLLQQQQTRILDALGVRSGDPIPGTGGGTEHDHNG